MTRFDKASEMKALFFQCVRQYRPHSSFSKRQEQQLRALLILGFPRTHTHTESFSSFSLKSLVRISVEKSVANKRPRYVIRRKNFLFYAKRPQSCTIEITKSNQTNKCVNYFRILNTLMRFNIFSKYIPIQYILPILDKEASII